MDSIIEYLLFLSLVLFLWFLRKKEYKLECMITLANIGLALLFYFISVNWLYKPSYYLRFLLVLVYILMVIITLIKIRKKSFVVSKNFIKWIIPSLCFIVSLYLIYQNITFLSGYSYRETPVHLSFPFRNGVYEVFWGGNGENNPLMNYHFNSREHKKAGTNVSMKYATDITKLNILGRCMDGQNLKQLEKYMIFGEKLYSPCDGEIINVQSGWKDNKAGDNMPYNTGNTIIIKTNNVYVLLGHLKNDSIVVKVGDKVKQGQQLAEVGSSGYSNGVPHLHIQAMKEPYWGSEGLPIVFNGRFPVKNSIFIK